MKRRERVWHKKKENLTTHIRPVGENTIPGGSFLFLARNGGCFSGEDECDDQAIQGEGLGENEDEDHDDEELGLLSRGTYAGISNNTNTDTGGQSGQTIGQTGCEMCKAKEVRVATLGDLTDQDDGDDEPVDTQHTSHNHRDDAAHHELGPHDTHGRHADPGLGRAVCGAQVGEDEGRRGAGETEERGCCWARHVCCEGVGGWGVVLTEIGGGGGSGRTTERLAEGGDKENKTWRAGDEHEYERSNRIGEERGSVEGGRERGRKGGTKHG